MADLIELSKLAFHDHMSYLKWIALPNFVAFERAFLYAYEDPSLGESVSPAELVRRFVNAAESLNNVLDHFYYDYSGKGDESHSNELRKFRTNVCKTHPQLNNISEIANAYKHKNRESSKQYTPTISSAAQMIRWPHPLPNKDTTAASIRAQSTAIIERIYIDHVLTGGRFWEDYSDQPNQTRSRLCEILNKAQ